MIKLNKKGAPTLATRKMVNSMNDLLDEMSGEDGQEFNKAYNSVEELENAYQQMKAKVGSTKSTSTHSPVNNSSNIEDAKVENISKEPDFSDSIPDSFEDFDFDPNAGEKIKRGYNDETTVPTLETIGEPIFSQETIANEPQVDTSNPQYSQKHQQHINGNAPESTKPQEITPANPALTEADEKTKRIAAEQFVDLILNGYDTLHEMVKPFAQIKDKKISELERKGLVNRADTVTVNVKGDESTLREVLHESNLAIDSALTPDPTFHANVRPPMIREFTKRGLGLTDMQTIALYFGKDIGTKLIQIIGVKRNLSSIIDIFKEQQKERQEGIARQNVQQVSPDSISQSQTVREEEHIMETEEV